MKLHEIADLTNQERNQLEINRNNIGQWLHRMKIQNFTIHPDTNVVDVAGDVDLGKKTFFALPIQFGRVDGDFFIAGCPNLRTLKGSPYSVGGVYQCFNTPITSLEGAPKYVGTIFACDGTPNMKSLSGIHKVIHEIQDQFWGRSDATHILGLLRIHELKYIDLDGTDGPINTIMNNHLENHDVLGAQEELLRAGFIEQAQL
jgi:hypothetical protein